jgi:hypothetical protein
VALPPEAPKLTEVKPAPAMPSELPRTASDHTQKELDKLFKNLNVPEPTLPPLPKQVPVPVRQSPPRPSVREELEQIQKQAQNIEPPLPLPRQKVAPPPNPSPAPAVAIKTSLRNPATAIQARGGGPGFNPYLSRVQRIISQGWTAPPVDPTVQYFQVVVKFRLLRNGSVRDVVVEQTSGNEYYDMAGTRAVLSSQLPQFPESMTDAYLDAHFSFTVGEQAG